MKKRRFSEEQKVALLREHRSGRAAKEICAEHNISPQTLYSWKRKFGDMDESDARRLKSLEQEAGRMKRIIADQAMQIDLLKEINSKKW